MGTINPTLPTISNPNSTEDPLIRAALSTIIAEFNGNIDNNNVKSAAAIAYSKLATMNTGQILLGNAGVPTATTLSGDVTVSALGVAAIGSGKVTSTMILDGTIGSGDIATGGILSGNISDGTIVNADINASAAIADTKLASSNQGSYRTLVAGYGRLANGSSNTSNDNVLPADSGVILLANTDGKLPSGITINSTDYAVTGFTPKLRIRGTIFSPATQTSTTLGFALYPVTLSGGLWAVGTKVSGSDTTTSANQAANTQVNVVTTTPFTFPAAGFYALGITFTGAGTTNGETGYAAQLEYAHF